jgi:hypothetical protein
MAIVQTAATQVELQQLGAVLGERPQVRCTHKAFATSITKLCLLLATDQTLELRAVAKCFEHLWQLGIGLTNIQVCQLRHSPQQRHHACTRTPARQ